MFKPKLINFNSKAYSLDLHNAKQELKAFNLVLVEVEKLIELPTDNEQYLELMKNPISYVELYFKRSYASKIDIPLSNKKLLELLEIDLNPLLNVLRNYTCNNITSIDCKAVTNVKKETYETYTTNQAQNTRLKEFNEFISTFKKITDSSFTNAYLHDLNRILGDKCYYSDGTLVPHINYIKNA